jgi:hypothetical protein
MYYPVCNNKGKIQVTEVTKPPVRVSALLFRYFVTSYIKLESMTEDQLQAQIFQWHWNNVPAERGLLFHVQQKARNAIEGNRFKAMGVVAGVSDLIYLKPGGKPILVELKTETGTQSPAQREWQQKAESAGYSYQIIRTLADFQKIVLT